MKLKIILGSLIAIPVIVVITTALSVKKSYEDKSCRFLMALNDKR